MSSSQKIYVLDTNILLHDPEAVHRFGDNHVVVPIVVIEELDRFKKEQNERGRNARMTSRILDRLGRAGPLSEGAALPHGGVLTVDLCQEAKEALKGLPALNGHAADNFILGVAVSYRDRQTHQVVVVTKDTNVRIKATAMGLTAEDYEFATVELDELYTGTGTLELEREQIDVLFSEGSLELDTKSFPPNQFLTISDLAEPGHTVLGRVAPKGGHLSSVGRFKQGIWGLYPRNREQTFAMDLLMDDSISLVTLTGKAGTGKTLLAIAAGLEKVAEEEVQHRLLVSRPVYPLGKDIGFLPGDIEEKLTPWMKPIYDNIEFLIDRNRERGHSAVRGYQELIDMGLLEIEALTYIRGRSIPNQYLIIDEAQNLTPHEIKTIITRAGDGTKVILTGDPNQIDNPYVDAASNGLSYVVDRFRNEPIAGHVNLIKGERSALAELAANLL